MSLNFKVVITWIILISVLLTILYAVFNYKNNREDPHALQVIEKKYNDSLIKSYNIALQLAKRDSSEKSEKIIALTDSINSLEKQINENDAYIQQSQVLYVYKVKYINSLSTDSLSMFFTARFGGK